MKYNWNKILKNKSYEELYHIAVGQSYLTDEVRKLAVKELEFRGFPFDNSDIIKKIFRLEKLNEYNEYHRDFSILPKKYEWIWLFTYLSLALLNVYNIVEDQQNQLFSIIMILIFIILIINNFLKFDNKKNEASKKADNKQYEINKLKNSIINELKISQNSNLINNIYKNRARVRSSLKFDKKLRIYALIFLVITHVFMYYVTF